LIQYPCVHFLPIIWQALKIIKELIFQKRRHLLGIHLTQLHILPHLTIHFLKIICYCTHYVHTSQFLFNLGPILDIYLGLIRVTFKVVRLSRSAVFTQFPHCDTLVYSVSVISYTTHILMCFDLILGSCTVYNYFRQE